MGQDHDRAILLMPSGTQNPGSYRRRKAAHLRLGRRGEALAARALTEAGIELLVRNFRCALGEVDIVAREGSTLCFIEVKTRRRTGRFRPAAAVGRAKQQRLVRVAGRYLREIGWPGVLHRFDIVEVLMSGRRVADIRHWRGAFDERSPDPASRFPDLPVSGRPRRFRGGLSGQHE